MIDSSTTSPVLLFKVITSEILKKTSLKASKIAFQKLLGEIWPPRKIWFKKKKHISINSAPPKKKDTKGVIYSPPWVYPHIPTSPSTKQGPNLHVLHFKSRANLGSLKIWEKDRHGFGLVWFGSVGFGWVWLGLVGCLVGLVLFGFVKNQRNNLKNSMLGYQGNLKSDICIHWEIMIIDV